MAKETKVKASPFAQEEKLWELATQLRENRVENLPPQISWRRSEGVSLETGPFPLLLGEYEGVTYMLLCFKVGQLYCCDLACKVGEKVARQGVHWGVGIEGCQRHLLAVQGLTIERWDFSEIKPEF